MSENEILRATLAAQRRHVLGALDGLADADLRRPLLPSGWTALGLVRHLTMDVERFWFAEVMAGGPAAPPGDYWHVGPDVPAAEVLDAYKAAADRTDEIIASTPPDAAPTRWPADLFGSWRLHTLRELILHAITETACHAGHLDAARELVDGHQWLVLDA